MDLGESIVETAVREVKEETGLDIEVTGLIGVYTNPRHVMAYTDGEVRQQFSLCLITHIKAGLDFLGWRIQRHRKRGTTKHYVHTYPAKKALKAITAKVKPLCRTDVNRPLPALLHRLNPVLRGWCAYFRPGVSSSTFQYLSKIAWYQVTKWIKRKHRRMTWKELRRRYRGGGWWPTTATGQLFDPGRVRVTRYRYRGAAIPTPWTTAA
jgi:RNA-directed DNA polymerase